MNPLTLAQFEIFRNELSALPDPTPARIATRLSDLIAGWTMDVDPIRRNALVDSWLAAQTSAALLPLAPLFSYRSGPCNRIDAGLLIALHGLAFEDTPGDWVIGSSDPRKMGQSYKINGASCDCRDTGAPRWHGFKACKHQIAVWLLRRARIAEDAHADTMATYYDAYPPAPWAELSNTI